MAQDSQNIDSLFDYFYFDKERVSALTAQLFPAGVLNSVKKHHMNLKMVLKN